MTYQIDQSGKIEETQRDTILAFSNKKSVAIRIRRDTKRKLQEAFRRAGKPRLFVLRVFCVGIFLLIKDTLREINDLVIDKEYPGKEKLIRSILLEFIEPRLPEGRTIHIRFANIGKNNPAHIKAYETYKGRQKENKILKLEDLRRLAIKNDRRVNA